MEAVRFLALGSLEAVRLLVTSVMLAVKFFDDVYYSNAYYAKARDLGDLAGAQEGRAWWVFDEWFHHEL